MSMDISVKFVDFWPSFDHDDNKFVRALRAKYDVTVLRPDETSIPDILFYSRCGLTHYRYDGSLKIYYTGENDVPDFNECDYALSFHDISFEGRHLRYPLYMMYEYDQAKNPPVLSDTEALDRPFCSFLMRNHSNCDPKRIDIVNAIEKYKPIAYGGAWRNNTNRPVEEKIPFISGYKFNLALENSRLPGYVTEKILEPFAAATVPIYWGAPDVGNDFNPDSYINVDDYDSLDSLVRDIRRIDNDDAHYLKILRTPALQSDRHIDFDARLSDFLCGIVSSGMRRHTVGYGEMNHIHRRNAGILPVTESRNKMRLIKIIQKLLP